MTQAALSAHQDGKVQVAIGRGSDFFGPWVTRLSSHGERVFTPALAGKAASFAADLDAPHTATYIGDSARALVVLGERQEALGQAWHVPMIARASPNASSPSWCSPTQAIRSRPAAWARQ